MALGSSSSCGVNVPTVSPAGLPAIVVEAFRSRPVRNLVHLQEIDAFAARYAGGNSAVLHLVLDRGFLSERAFLLVGEAVSVAIVGWTAREVSELVQLVPVHDPVGVDVLSRGKVMGHDCGFSR